MPANDMPTTDVIERRLRVFSGHDAADIRDIRWEPHRASRRQAIVDVFTEVQAARTTAETRAVLERLYRECGA